MKEESEDKKETLGLTVSEKWRKRHEGRMQTVGVCRGEKVVREVEKGKERKDEEIREVEPTPLQTLDKINSLWGGWEWG